MIAGDVQGDLLGNLGADSPVVAGGVVTRGADSVWVRQGPYAWDGPGGTRISAAQVGAGENPGWRYTAWGAEELPVASYWDWKKQAGNQERYERGQAPRQRRIWLGVYLTASEARQACLGWLKGARAGSGDV